MKYLFLAYFFLTIVHDAGKENPYAEYFGRDYKQALSLIENNQRVLDEALGLQNQPFKVSIVFPELVRYHMLKDLIETSALKTGYVRFGSSMVDFSIGYCQMKPSFIENIEQELTLYPALLSKYAFLLISDSIPVIDQRKLRVERLAQFSGQLNYLNAFIDILNIRYDSTNWGGSPEKLNVYATHYNAGLFLNAEQVLNLSHKKSFPYGTNFNHNPFTYNELALHYYNLSKN